MCSNPFVTYKTKILFPGVSVEVSELDMIQMCGRSGRMGIDTEGYAIVLLPLKEFEILKQKIEKSIGSKDWKEVFNQAHKIKSSLSVFGLNEMREIAFQLESNARDESNTSEIENLFESFRQKAAPVIEAITAELEKVKEV